MTVILASIAFWAPVTFACVGDDGKPEVLKFRARYKRLKKSEREALDHSVAAYHLTEASRNELQKRIDDPKTSAQQRKYWQDRLAAKTLSDAEVLNDLLVDWELKDHLGQFVAYTPATRDQLSEDFDGFEGSLVTAYFDAVKKPLTVEDVEKNSEAQSATTS